MIVVGFKPVKKVSVTNMLGGFFKRSEWSDVTPLNLSSLHYLEVELLTVMIDTSKSFFFFRSCCELRKEKYERFTLDSRSSSSEGRVDTSSLVVIIVVDF